jgi:molybdopterin biosynthesis enzyme
MMMGCNAGPEMLHLPLGKDFKRKKSERKLLIPVRIENGLVLPVEYHVSAHISAYAQAQGIITIEIGNTELKKGEIADVRPI